MEDKKGDNPFGEVISSYSRAQAIEDGMLVDVTETAKEAGVKYPTVVTNNLFATWINPSDKAKRYGQDLQGRLWDVLFVFTQGARKSADSHITFKVIFADGPAPADRHTVTLWAICDGGDTGEPVITIMLPEDY